MSACEAIVFNEITQEKWSCIKQTVQQKTGIVIDADSGTTTRSAFTVTWNCNLETQVLTFQVTDKPMMIPCETIYSRFREVINRCASGNQEIE
ncbi:MAG TPA: hypothetical protein VG649_07545 [Candidatus Angelobacter sp.]|jgi:uncharacterized Fe-S cluster protein YjdI|nr:hypothetical protein [Candidatus Angelobacter sp.]